MINHHESLAQYIQRLRQEDFFQMPDAGDSDLMARAQAAIIEALHKLDTLPRDDSFWDNTNGAATIYKLGDFVHRLLRDNPNDEQALWYSAALAVYHCGNNFGLPAWQGLHRLQRLDTRWPLFAAFYVETKSGANTAHQLAKFLREIDACASVAQVLQHPLNQVDTAFVRFATKVIIAC